jgi:hypothetical protein
VSARIVSSLRVFSWKRLQLEKHSVIAHSYVVACTRLCHLCHAGGRAGSPVSHNRNKHSVARTVLRVVGSWQAPGVPKEIRLVVLGWSSCHRYPQTPAGPNPTSFCHILNQFAPEGLSNCSPFYLHNEFPRNVVSLFRNTCL